MGNDMIDSLGSCVNNIKKDKWSADASRAFADWFVKNKLNSSISGFEYCKDIQEVQAKYGYFLECRVFNEKELVDAMKRYVTIIPVVSGGFLVKDLY